MISEEVPQLKITDVLWQELYLNVKPQNVNRQARGLHSDTLLKIISFVAGQIGVSVFEITIFWDLFSMTTPR